MRYLKLPKNEHIVLEPTGTCFDDVLEYIGQLMREKKDREDLLELIKSDYPKVVHGICLFDDGKPYAHCWMEEDARTALGSAIYKGQKIMGEWDLNEFYKIMKVKKFFKYTLAQIAKMENLHGHPGPWAPCIKELTKDFKHSLES